MKCNNFPPVLSDVIDSMNDGLFLVSPDGRILMANDALLQLTGYSREELLGQPCTVFRCDECDRHLGFDDQHWCRLFATGKRIRQRCHLISKDGRSLPVIKASQVVCDGDGDIIATVENVTDISDILQAEQRIGQLEERLEDSEEFCGMVGRSPPMRHLYKIVEQAANSDASVIIYGESGVGKELVAQAIHSLGPRKDKPFVQINCAAFNEHLLESELFGHVRGAFTGAHRHRLGRFEEVRDGDLFLDEVGDIPLPTQVKLLRVLDTRQFERVGDNQQLPMDGRLISATNQNLDTLSLQRRFRRDFFYRINVVPIHVPPLRERRSDIPLLTDVFIQRLRKRTPRDVVGLTPEAMARLDQYDWPGNVRELRSALEYAFVVCSEGYIDLQHLPVLESGTAGIGSPPPGEAPVVAPRFMATPERDISQFSVVERIQRNELINALREKRGNKSAAARKLGVTRTTVLNRMRKYGIDLQQILVS